MINWIKKYKKVVLLAAAVLVLTVFYFVAINGKKSSTETAADKQAASPSSAEKNISIELETEGEAQSEPEQVVEEPAPENLKEGVEHSSVTALQERLMELGFMENDEPTQYYGGVTATAVKTFQRQNGLDQDGVAGPETLAVILSPEAKYYAVSLGISGSDVKRIQNRLYELGYLSESQEVNGTFDETTEKAVTKLQEINQLNMDGKVGRQTINLLYSEEIKPNFLTYGEENEVVLASQNRLKALGYLTTVPDGNYGKDTVLAVKQFQSRNDLVVDGYLGPSTRTILKSEGARPNGLVLGEEGDGVKRVQELLIQYGYLSSANATGYFGEVTEKAVKSFQSNNKLTADGSVGIQTLSALTGDKIAKAKAGTNPASGKENGGSKSSGGTLSGSVQALIDVAASKVGSKYVWGSKGPNSFDCSGFVYWSLNQIGVRQSYLTSSGWRNVGKFKKITNYDEIKPGDIVVEKGHMGIAAPGGTVIDASSGNGKVVYRKRTNWWRSNFIVAWRIFE